MQKSVKRKGESNKVRKPVSEERVQEMQYKSACTVKYFPLPHMSLMKFSELEFTIILTISCRFRQWVFHCQCIYLLIHSCLFQLLQT